MSVWAERADARTVNAGVSVMGMGQAVPFRAVAARLGMTQAEPGRSRLGAGGGVGWLRLGLFLGRGGGRLADIAAKDGGEVDVVIVGEVVG